MAQKAKKEKMKKIRVVCGMCNQKVILDKNHCCPKCGAVIVFKNKNKGRI